MLMSCAFYSINRDFYDESILGAVRNDELTKFEFMLAPKMQAKYSTDEGSNYVK
jgi:hypothetical protein